MTATNTGADGDPAVDRSQPLAHLVASPIVGLIEESYGLERAGDIGAALQRAGQALERALRDGEPEAIAAAQVCVASTGTWSVA